MKTILQFTFYAIVLSNSFLMGQKIELQNNALHFDGIDDTIKISHFERPNIFTIELWVKSTEVSSNPNHILAWATNDISNGKFTSGILTHYGYISYVEHNGKDFPTTTDVFYADGDWHHIAITRNENSVNNVKFYFDGNMVSESTINIDVKTDNFKIGAISYNKEHYSHFKGTLDEIRIWNYEKKQTQIQDQMNTILIGGNKGLLAYYNFNQGIANGENKRETILNDKSVSNRLGSLNGFSLKGTMSNWVGGFDQAVLSANSSFNMTSQSLSVFPNPSKNIIHISGLSQTEEFEIFDAVGKKIKNGFVSKNKSIHIEDFSIGNYFLKLGDGNIIRFIKE